MLLFFSTLLFLAVFNADRLTKLKWGDKEFDFDKFKKEMYATKEYVEKLLKLNCGLIHRQLKQRGERRGHEQKQLFLPL